MGVPARATEAVLAWLCHPAGRCAVASGPHSGHRTPLRLCAMQFKGLGSSANILQGDIVACGPSIIHLVDQVRFCMLACWMAGGGPALVLPTPGP